jgi:hypothetical protein
VTRKKVHLLLDDEAQATLLALQTATGASSAAEVMRDALAVYNSLQEMLEADPKYRLALYHRSAGTIQELFVPSLMRKVSPVASAESYEIVSEGKLRL